MVFDSRYNLEMQYEYDNSGNLLETLSSTENPLSIIWNNNGYLPIAKTYNARYEQTAYSDFEYGNTGRWTIDYGNTISHSSAISGDKVFQYINGDYGPYAVVETDPNCKYALSFWAENTGSLPYQVVGNNIILIDSYQSQPNENNWIFYEFVFQLVGGNTIGVFKNGEYMLLDNLKLYPQNAFMETYYYNDKNELETITDANEQSVYFEYDKFGRLKLKRDQDKNIIEKTIYHLPDIN
ncbi:MAG: hypothetical protein R2764_24425 [Bacteroidales bacterium]